VSDVFGARGGELFPLLADEEQRRALVESDETQTNGVETCPTQVGVQELDIRAGKKSWFGYNEISARMTLLAYLSGGEASGSAGGRWGELLSVIGG
jgi:hypothetical protein